MSRGTASLAMRDFFGAGARGLVAAQQALDAQARERLVAWEENGVPPTGWYWAACRLRFPIAFGCALPDAAGALPHLTVAPGGPAGGSLTLSIAYLPAPQDEDLPGL